MKTTNNKTSNKWYNALTETAADILWPKKCIMCGCLVPIGRKAAVCDDCSCLIKKHCTDFVEPDRYFEEAIGALPYESRVRDAMIRYKFSGHAYLKSAFSHAVMQGISGRNFLGEYRLVCPVPIHPLRDREYNQSLLIARELADALGLDLCPDLLIKTKNLTPLSTMGYAMRRSSIVGAIDFNVKYDIFGKNILLLDDIYTTGSTADECSKILKMNGAANVIVIAACYADRKGDDNNADANNLSH